VGIGGVSPRLRQVRSQARRDAHLGAAGGGRPTLSTLSTGSSHTDFARIPNLRSALGSLSDSSTATAQEVVPTRRSDRVGDKSRSGLGGHNGSRDGDTSSTRFSASSIPKTPCIGAPQIANIDPKRLTKWTADRSRWCKAPFSTFYDTFRTTSFRSCRSVTTRSIRSAPARSSSSRSRRAGERSQGLQLLADGLPTSTRCDH